MLVREIVGELFETCLDDAQADPRLGHVLAVAVKFGTDRVLTDGDVGRQSDGRFEQVLGHEFNT